MERRRSPRLHPLTRAEKATTLEYVGRSSLLQFAHDEGIVHRDVKSSNVMIDNDGVARLMDLGLAKSLSEDSGMTIAGTVLGTPHYMSVEQALDPSTVDARSDLWSLAVVVWMPCQCACLIGNWVERTWPCSTPWADQVIFCRLA